MILARNLALSVALLVVPAASSAGPVAPGDTSEVCASPEQQAKLSRFQERLAGVDSVERAKKIADRRLRRVRRALERGQDLHPDSEEIVSGLERLEGLEFDIAAADSPGGVANAFVPIAQADGVPGCQMSAGEVLATVLGFVLGIIPGIILLLLLC